MGLALLGGGDLRTRHVGHQGGQGVGAEGESVCPEAEVWALCHSRVGYKALTPPHVTPLTLHNVPRRIRICLDCQEGRMVFFDAVSKARIFAFLWASFKGDLTHGQLVTPKTPESCSMVGPGARGYPTPSFMRFLPKHFSSPSWSR